MLRRGVMLGAGPMNVGGKPMRIRWNTVLGVLLLLLWIPCEVLYFYFFPWALRGEEPSISSLAVFYLSVIVLIPWFFLGLGVKTLRDRNFAVMSLGVVAIFGVGVFLPLLLLYLLIPISRPMAAVVAVSTLAAGVTVGIVLVIVGWRRVEAAKQSHGPVVERPSDD